MDFFSKLFFVSLTFVPFFSNFDVTSLFSAPVLLSPSLSSSESTFRCFSLTGLEFLTLEVLVPFLVSFLGVGRIKSISWSCRLIQKCSLHYFLLLQTYHRLDSQPTFTEVSGVLVSAHFWKSWCIFSSCSTYSQARNSSKLNIYFLMLWSSHWSSAYILYIHTTSPFW